MEIVSSYVASMCSKQWMVNLVLSFLFFLAFIYTTFYFLRLWFEGSKLSFRKRAFLFFMIAANVRSCWYFAHWAFGSSVPVLGTTSMFDMRNLYLALSEFFYYWPFILIHHAVSQLVLNWFQLYQKEKLRRKLEIVNLPPTPSILKQQLKKKIKKKKLRSESKSSQSSSAPESDLVPIPSPRPPPFDPLAALKKSRHREKTLDKINTASVVLVYGTLFGAILSHLNFLASTDYLRSLAPSGFPSIPMLVVPTEVVISTVEIFTLFWLAYTTFRILANLKKAKSSNILKLVRHSKTTVNLLVACVFYYLAVIFLCGLRLYAMGSSSVESQSPCDHLGSLAIFQHFLLRSMELLFIFSSIRSLKSGSLSLRPQFPRNHKFITKKWLQDVLRENGTIPMHAKLAGFKVKKLQGGCHYKCSRVKLFYNDRVPGAPDTVVVKLLYHDQPIFERLRLYTHLLFGNYSIKEVQYLASYRIESHFYKHQYYNLRGLKIPEVYFNIEDCFNHKFGMVVQDLSKLEDGQPFGFNMLDTVLCVKQLAKWHATNWGNTPSKKEVLTWNLGGYWTADKRLHAKMEVREGWQDTSVNFPSLKLTKHYPDLGNKLFQILEWLPEKIHDIKKKYKTLIHGDFKISNLFLDNGRPRYGTLKPTTPSSLKNDKFVNPPESKFVNFSPLSSPHPSDSDSSPSPSPVMKAGGLIQPESFSLDPEESVLPKSPMKKGKKASRSEKKRLKNQLDSSISLESLLAAKSRKEELISMIDQQSDYAERVYTIDWQWFGFGNCCIDIAYFLNTSLQVDLLPVQDELMKLYYDTLVSTGNVSYSYQTFLYHYQLCHIDFCLYAIVCKWARMTPEDFNKYQMECKDGMHLRSLAHMHNIIRRTAEIIREWGDVSQPPKDPE